MQTCTHAVQTICTTDNMPKTKAYIDRTRILNRLFRSRFYTLEQLTERVNRELGNGVKERTIEKDIMDMRAEGAPILNEPGKGYIYDPIAYNHFEIKISPAHIEKIKLASSLLKQIPGLDVHEELNYIFEDLQMKAETEEEEVTIQFDTRPNYEGAKYMVDILEAIRGKRVISFDYQPFKYDSAKLLTVHPYILKEFNNRWFLIGLQENMRQEQKYEFQQFALERIKSKIKAEGRIKHFQPNEFDPATLYKNVYGISRPYGGKVERIVLRFAPERAKYVTTNQLHPSQQKVKGEESVFEFDLIPNNELETLILSYGADVEVLEPRGLRDKIATMITEAHKKYF